MKKLTLCLCLCILSMNHISLKAYEWKALYDDWYLLDDTGCISKGIVKNGSHYEWFDQKGRWLRTLTYPMKLSGYQLLDSKMADVLDLLYDPSASDYEQLMILQNWIIKQAHYEKQMIDVQTLGTYETDYEQIGIQLRLIESAPILFSNAGLCFNYAACFYWMCQSLGYESMIITGTWRGEPHSWNAVYLDQWYTFDVTMADSFNDYYSYFMMDKLNNDYKPYDIEQSIRFHQWQSYTDLEQEGIAVIRNIDDFKTMLQHAKTETLDFFYVGDAICMDMNTILKQLSNISYLTIIPLASDYELMLKGKMMRVTLTSQNPDYDQWRLKNQQSICLIN